MIDLHGIHNDPEIHGGAIFGNSDCCERCGAALTVGCSSACRDLHAPVGNYHPFIPYFDFALGQEVTSLAQRWGFMKGEIDRETGERRGQLEYRDKMSAGELSARRDRVEAQRRERARG